MTIPRVVANRGLTIQIYHGTQLYPCWLKVSSLYSTWNYPQRPRRDLYDEYNDDDGNGGGGNNYKNGDWNYERTWRDFIYDNRRIIRRGALIIGGGGAYYWYHLEPAPITGRKRFMALSESQESMLAENSFQEIIKEYRGSILPPGHPAVRFVEKVAQRLIDALDTTIVPKSTKWRIFVVESPTVNAFVLPGGDIFVFTGILPVAQDESGLAAILSHEIAHQLARHGAEKLSFYQFFNILSGIFQVFITGDLGSPFSGVLKNLFLFLPFSRKCETEADYIGLLLMARACYDPNNAVSLWKRMQQVSQGKEMPAFMSTHPSHEHRIERLTEWLPKANQEYESSNCYEKYTSFRNRFPF